MFIPDKECNCPDLVATTGDYLRIWQLTEEGTTLQKLLNNVSSLVLPGTPMVLSSVVVNSLLPLLLPLFAAAGFATTAALVADALFKSELLDF